MLGIPTTWSGRRLQLFAVARARLALEPLIRRARRKGTSRLARFSGGDSATRPSAIAEPLLGGIHAGDIEALSMRSLFPRFVEAEARVVAACCVRFAEDARPPRGWALPIARRRAWASSSTRWTRAFRPAIDPTRRAASPRSSRTEALACHSRWDDRDGAAHLLACPAHVAAALLRPLDQRGRRSLCAEVPYVSTVSVALAWPRGAVAHPLNGYRLRRRAATQRASHHRVHVGVVEVEPAGAGRNGPASRLRGRRARSRRRRFADEALVDLAREISSVLGFDRPAARARVYRWRRAGAQHNVGQIARVAEIGAPARHPGIFVAGSGFRSVGIPDCVADGRAAAAAACTYY